MSFVLLTQSLSNKSHPPHPLVDALLLSADDRKRSLGQAHSHLGQGYQWQLPRGTCLYHQDFLGTPLGDRWVQVLAKPEPVLTVTSHNSLHLMQAAYHLGNRHVPLEIQSDYLRLSPDPVLHHLLVHHLHLEVIEEILPFEPEPGAYQTHHSH
ncbi:MAG: urease accessory protein UreE, partial [Prochlorotrichaceae cyanobacterium]|jgi:urease accessory protein